MSKRTGDLTSTQRAAGPLTGWPPPALAIVAAIVLNVIILTVGRLISGEFPVANVGSDDQTIGVIAVIVVTAIVGLVAWGLLVLLTRTTARPAKIWTVIAVVILLISLTGPLGSGVNTSSKIVLLLLHIGAAIAIIPVMGRATK